MPRQPRKQKANHMTKRHSNAIAISDGACNPSGIAHSIIEACQEIREANGGTQAMYDDPALKLMVHQLAFLMKIDPDTDWSDWRKACETQH
jgi:hypothetical protein